MKRLIFGMMIASVLSACGCGRSGTAGGPGATNTGSTNSILGQAKDTFSLRADSATVNQGEVSESRISITRGTNFDQDVALSFKDLPVGITITPAQPVIYSADNEVKLSYHASDSAVVGDYTVKLIGHPSRGGDSTNEIKFKVEKKDSFTLTMPFWTTALKQDESKMVTISISRDKKFTQDVAIRFDSLPSGITLEPASIVIKNGDNDAKFMMKASDHASIGDFSIKATGHPSKGSDATHDFKFSVAKK